MVTTETSDLGRAASTVADEIRRGIAEGHTPAGRFLPSIRHIAAKHSIDHKTVRRALKALEAEGLVAAVARRGYRVQAKANDPKVGCPMAYLGHYVDEEGGQPGSGRVHFHLRASLEQAAARRAWSVLVMAVNHLPPAGLAEFLESQRAFGVVLDTVDPEIIRVVRRADIAAVIVDGWARDAGIDSVMQDGQLGGMLAAEHLLGQGCRRIAWFGRSPASAHSRDRFSGALSTLEEAGETIPARWRLAVERGVAQMKAVALRLLSGKDRPDAVIALWSNCALAVKKAADELGLVIGKDVHLVGWGIDEAIEAVYRPTFAGGALPPIVSWSVRDLAETAVARLAERRETPDLAAVRVKVPVKLRIEE
jgi:LacI family transcriptional regulator